MKLRPATIAGSLVAALISPVVIGLAGLAAPASAAAAATTTTSPTTPVPWSSNLLSGNAADFRTGNGGWIGVALTNLQHNPGAGHDAAGSLAATNSGLFSTYAVAQSAGSASDGIATTPGTRFSASTWVKAGSTGRSFAIGLVFYNATGTRITTVNGQAATDTVASWTQVSVVAIAPPAAASVVVQVAGSAVAPNETHLIDDVVLRSASGSSSAIVGPLRTDGTRILDAYGNAVTFRGVNRGGMEDDPVGFPDDNELANAKAWGVNMVRLNLGSQFWLSSSCSYSPTYATSVDQAVDRITSRGMVALIDLHWLSVTACGGAGEKPMPDVTGGVQFWQQVASRYKDNPRVAFDLYNEPNNVSDTVWRDGGTITLSSGVTYQAAGMQRLYDTVRATGATNLTVVSGTHFAEEPSSLRIVGTNIVYGGHIYTCMDAPPTCTTPNPTDPSTHFSRWTNVASTAPFIVTEFGYPVPDDGTYNQRLVNYAESQGWSWLQFTWANYATGEFRMLTTAGAVQPYEPKPSGMAALAAFPGVAAPVISSPSGGAALATAAVPVTGTALPGTTVRVRDGGTVVATTIVDDTGTWSATTTSLGDGTHRLTATDTDQVGTISPASSPVDVTVDTTAPNAPTITAPEDGAVIASHAVTVTGGAEPGSTVGVRVDGTPTTSADTNSTGGWTADLTLTDGHAVIDAVATDAVGNHSPASDPVAVDIDTVAPDAPVITAPVDGSLLSHHGVTVRGTTTEPGADITVVIDGEGQHATAAGPDSEWQLDVDLADGSHTIRAHATDAAGNDSPSSAPVTVDIDTTAPDSPVISTPADGLRTSATDVTVGGAAEPGSTVTLTDGTGSWTTSADEEGAWTLTAGVDDGTHAFRATATDAAGNTSDESAATTVTVDSTAPDAPVIDTPADAAVSTSSHLTIAGTAEPGATVDVTDGTTTVSATADADGAWSVTVTYADGTHDIVAVATDDVGNTSAPSTTHRVTIDTVAPDAPVIASPADGTASAHHDLTISGTAEPGATVTVTDDGATIALTDADNDGAWSADLDLADGGHDLAARATDAAGNESPDSATHHVTVDTTSPGVPELISPVDGFQTAHADVTVTGTADAATSIVLVVDGSDATTVTSGNDGTWHADITLTDGTHTIRVHAVDEVGNQSADTAAVTVTVDTTAPDAPTISSPHSGVLLSTNAVTVAGQAEPAASVTVIVDGTAARTVTSDDDGTWQADVTLGDGTHSVTATATDALGNRSAESAPTTVSVDTTAPARPVITSPATDTLTNDATITVAGTAEAGVTVTLTNGTTTRTTSADEDGGWSTTATYADGTHAFVATATDAAGNRSQPSTTRTVTIDTHAPSVPTFTDPGAGSTVTRHDVAAAGTAEAGSTVRITEANTTLALVTSDSTGRWNATLTLADGVHDLVARATDAAGNASAYSATRRVTVDTTVDVSVTSSLITSTPTAGQPLTVRYQVSNAGPVAATATGLSVALPGTATSVSATTDTGSCSVSGSVSCTIGNLPSGATATVNVTLTPTKQGSMSLTGVASTSASDRATNNNSSSLTVTVKPGNGRIGFMSMRDGNAEIYTMNADGSALTRLTTNSKTDTSPQFSPDGTKIAFSSNRDGNTEIYVMNANGSGVVRLTNNSATDDYPAWSPDGTKIAFSTTRDKNTEIYVMNANGSGVVRLTNNSATDDHPAWSPDGRRIAFDSTRDKNVEVYTMNADGSGLIRVTNNSGTDDHPAWSPDGTKLAFSSTRTGTAQVWVANSDGSGLTRLSTGSGAATEPVWAPTGAYVAYTTTTSSNADVATVTTNGSTVRVLTNSKAADSSASWQAL